MFRRVAADSILRLMTRVPADSIVRLTGVSAARYELRRTPSHDWFEFRQLDVSYSWLHPTVNSSSGGWIRLKADTILRLTRVAATQHELQLIPSCSWLGVATDPILRLTRVLPAELDLRLLYTLIYQVNLRTCSEKSIIFLVCFLPPDFSYHWFRLCLLLQEPWRSLEQLQRSSCD